MKIVVNGAPRDVPDGITIGALLDQLSIPRAGVAVAVAMRVVPRSDHDSTPLNPDDHVEIIQAVGGG